MPRYLYVNSDDGNAFQTEQEPDQQNLEDVYQARLDIFKVDNGYLLRCTVDTVVLGNGQEALAAVWKKVEFHR